MELATSSIEQSAPAVIFKSRETVGENPLSSESALTFFRTSERIFRSEKAHIRPSGRKTNDPENVNSRGHWLTVRSRDSAAGYEARQEGLEPSTFRLTAGCSTIELLPKFSPADAGHAHYRRF